MRTDCPRARLLGYWLGGVPQIRDDIDAAVLLIVVFSFLPPALEYLRRKVSVHR